MFRLTEGFLEPYKSKAPPWGPVGQVTYSRTYSRRKEDGTMEDWWETIKRVVEGSYKIQESHCRQFRLPWSANKAQRSAQEMYRRVFEMKFLPPGRGLWAMGTGIIDKIGAASLMNCAFASSKDLSVDFAGPFAFLMDMSMLGVGVGFDTLGANTITIKEPRHSPNTFVVDDSREGWVDLISNVLNAYIGANSLPVTIDYSKVRPSGVPIKTFGGTASGPGPLDTLVRDIDKVLAPLYGEKITSGAIVDLMNVIGKCVVAGNVRRTAELSLGDLHDEEYLQLKNPDTNQKALFSHRWASNNSVSVNVGDDYSHSAALTAKNGEPGYVWLENCRNYGRMGENGSKDYRVAGVNPSLAAGTRVYTSEGIVPIEQLQDRNFAVRNLYGEPAPATCWLSGKDKSLTKIVLDNGQVYHATPEHKWPIYTPQGYVKCETSDLRVGHMLPIKKFNSLNFGHLGTYEDGFLVGWLHGDGNVTVRSDNGKRQYNWVVGLEDVDQGIADRLLDSIHRITGGQQNWVERSSTWELATTHRTMDEFMQSFGVQGKRFGFPTKIWTDVSEQFRLGFVDALFSADGEVDSDYKKARIGIGQSNEPMIQDLADLLGFYGIKVQRHVIHVSSAKFPNGKNYNKSYTSYKLRISHREAIQHFKSIFQLSHADKQFKINSISRHDSQFKLACSHAVIKEIIEDDLRGDCWDVSVFDYTHCFQISGCMTGNCAEQTLEDREMCCLVETFPSRHDSLEDYLVTLKFAYLYGKTVTLVPTHDERSNAVLMRNRRIGTSQSGIVQSFQKIGRREHLRWSDEGYKYIRQLDEKYSDWLCVPKSIKVTTVKPSGTVSLLPGVTPGIHYPHSEYYNRTIRFKDNSPLVGPLEKAGYHIEVDAYSPATLVVYFPIHEEHFDRSKTEVSMWEQLENAAQMNQYWSDNAVSITVTFKPEEAKDIKRAIELYETRLKTVSFLPLQDHGYEQAPYQEISKEEYNAYSKKLKPVDWSGKDTHELIDNFCDAGSCELIPR